VAYLLRGLVAAVLSLLVRVGWFFDGLPQHVVWVVLLIVLGYLTLLMTAKAKPAKEIRAPVTAPTPSDLAELVRLVRWAEFSFLARSKLGRRLAGAAVALRVRQEAIPSRQAWDDLEEGRWPRNAQHLAVLRPGQGWRLPMRNAPYPRQLQDTVDALWNYAKGGKIDRN